MKKIFIAILLVIFSAPAGWSATVDCAANCTNSALTTAIASAGVDGTVNIPAGNFTWTGSVSISRGIKIVGAGNSLSNITRSGEAFSVNMSSTARTNGEIFELSDVNINGSNSGTMFALTGPSPTSSSIPPPTLVNIHDSTLKNSGQGGHMLQMSGIVYGSLYSNTFDRIGVFIQWLGVNGANCSGYEMWKWRTGFSYGDDEALYVEGNTFQYSSNCSSCTDPAWIETGWGAPGIVVRYNNYSFTNQGDVGEMWDIHGLQYGCSGGQCSTQKVEYYGNIISGFPSGWARMINMRGSWGLFFNNKASGVSQPNVELYGESCNPAPNCETGFCDFDSGCVSLLPGVTQEVNNTYIWNTIWGSSTQMVFSMNYGNYCSLAENSDWWEYNSGCTASSCSSGVGVGSSTPTGTCTTGVGYWKWTQGTTLPSSMDDMITYTQAGTFYKCDESGQWQEYYTPYQYPYFSEAGDTTPPVITNTTPNGTKMCNTNPSTIIISVTTDENATCKFDTSDTVYDSMTYTFSTTGTTSHSDNESKACGSSYTYYVRCMDESSNKSTSSTTITFKVGSAKLATQANQVIIN